MEVWTVSDMYDPDEAATADLMDAAYRDGAPEEEPRPDPLAEYTTAAFNLEDFKDAHASVLVDLERLQTKLNQTEAALKEFARGVNSPEAKSLTALGLENQAFVVTVTHKLRKWYDADMILERYPAVRELEGVVITTMDKKKIELLAKGGMIPQEIADLAFKAEPMTPEVRIKRKG
jgi:hypothetical protein